MNENRMIRTIKDITLRNLLKKYYLNEGVSEEEVDAILKVVKANTHLTIDMIIMKCISPNMRRA